MSASSTGSSATRRAADSSAAARAVCPPAHALRDGQVGGAFRGVGRGPVCAAPLGPDADVVQRGGNIGVRAVGGYGAMPRCPVGVRQAVQCGGQRPVRGATFGCRGGLVDR
jgi:hypothetical protein